MYRQMPAGPRYHESGDGQLLERLVEIGQGQRSIDLAAVASESNEVPRHVVNEI